MQARIDTNSFNRVIAATKNFVDTSGMRPARTLIRLEFSAEDHCMTAIALDGFRMAVETSVCECDEDFTAYVHGGIRLPRGQEAEIAVEGGEALIRCGGLIYGCKQPSGEFLDWRKALLGPPAFKIAFNGNYLLSALQAAKASCGNTLRKPVVLEFRGPTEPVILRTNQNDIKMVLPVRIRE